VSGFKESLSSRERRYEGEGVREGKEREKEIKERIRGVRGNLLRHFRGIDAPEPSPLVQQ